MDKNNKNSLTLMVCGIFILIIGLFLSVSLGAARIGLSEIWDSIFRFSDKLELILIRDVRIPRVLCVLITGGVLGTSGAMVQGVTRNPIAEPSLLGVSQGAILVVACFYAAGISITTVNVMIASSIGAVFSGMIVLGFILKRSNYNSITKILLGGTAMGTFFISLTTVVGLLSNKAQFIAFWVGGGFRNANWSEVILITTVGIPGLIIAILLSKKINVLSLGDDVAISLGQNPEKIRLITILIMIPMCAAAVAVGKNIGFVGLIVPQIVKKVIGEDYRKNIPLSFLLGAVLLTYSDILARMVFTPYEIPIGVFTSLIGVPFFIAAARKEKG
jgi:iron complex transport system permease protein